MPYPVHPDGGQDPQGGLRRPRLTRRALLAGTLQTLALLTACTVPLPATPAPETPAPANLPPATPTPSPAPSPSPAATPGPASAAQTTPAGVEVRTCAQAAVVPPTAVPYPGYTQVEPETGLHVTNRPEQVDLAAWRLEVTGLVDRPLSLTYDEVRCLPVVKSHVNLTCPGFFTDGQFLAGPTVATVLALAGPQAGAKSVTFTSTAGFPAHQALADALAAENFLAHSWKDELLPISHGFPLRAVFPGRTGGIWVKWLATLELS